MLWKVLIPVLLLALTFPCYQGGGFGVGFNTPFGKLAIMILGTIVIALFFFFTCIDVSFSQAGVNLGGGWSKLYNSLTAILKGLNTVTTFFSSFSAREPDLQGLEINLFWGGTRSLKTFFQKTLSQ